MSALDRFKRCHVVVAIPSLGGIWKEQFGMSLLAFFNYFHANKLGDFRDQRLMPASIRSSMLPNARLELLKYAINIKATHLLFVDTDQTFPKDLLHRLLKHDVDVVACNIATKQIPANPTARTFNAAKPGSGDKVYNVPSKGLQKVWRVGTGVMLLKMKVFDKIGINVFGMPWQEGAQRYQGEDWTLVECCEKAGIDVYIDHEVSEQVKHIGDYAYDHNVVGTMEKFLSPELEALADVSAA